MREVQALAEKILRMHLNINVLVHCAGVTLKRRTITPEGLETVFAVQYLARYMLSNRLLPMLEANQGTVIVVSAGGTMPTTTFSFENLQGETYYTGVHALKHESLANDMLVLDAASLSPSVTWYNYGPGVVRTKLLSDMGLAFQTFVCVAGYFLSIAPDKAADDIIILISSQHRPSGLYIRGPKLKKTTLFRSDPQNRIKLRTISNALVERALWTPGDGEK